MSRFEWTVVGCIGVWAAWKVFAFVVTVVTVTRANLRTKEKRRKIAKLLDVPEESLRRYKDLR